MPVHRKPESSDKWYHVRSGSEKQKLRASPKNLKIFVKNSLFKILKKIEKGKFLKSFNKTLNPLNLSHY